MKDEPVQIIHLDLDQLTDEAVAVREDVREALVVYWSGERAVAQRSVDVAGNTSVSARALAARLGPGRPQVSAPATRADGPSLRVSVVICTRDRPRDLARCLASLPGQTRGPDEVIVVDNAPRDELTREAAMAAGVVYVREDRPGLDVARNAGARRAGGDIIVYTDDDVVLHHRWLERLVAAFDAPEVLGVTGLVLPASLDTVAQQMFERRWSFGRGFDRIDFGPNFYERTRSRGCPAWEVGAGANMAFRREAFERVGLFDERLDAGAAGCSGDSEMWYRLLAAGWTCRYEPSAVVFHHHRRTLDALSRQIRAYMRGHAAALLVQFERTGERGNLRRALVSLPRYYAWSLLRRLRDGPSDQTMMLGEEVAGFLGGLLFYLRHARRPSRRARPSGRG